MLITKNTDASISVCKMNHHPLWCNVLPQDGNMENFLNKKVINKRSQDIQEYYRINGAIYICNTELLLKNKSFFLNKNIYAYKMKIRDSVDIDELIDLKIADIFMKNKY